MTGRGAAAGPADLDPAALLRSWRAREGVHATEELLEWVDGRNRSCKVEIERIGLSSCDPWYMDAETGRIRNGRGAFFSVAGLSCTERDLRTGEERSSGQPAILQSEVGFLGIVAASFGGVPHLLMQAKIEPGNVNKVQVSPTIQATRSNFMRAHGGREPEHLALFTGRSGSRAVVDQLQSEQSLRFLSKRNRNVVLAVDGAPSEGDAFRWMTLGQVKDLMRYENLVNMDARTVISCMPLPARPDAAERAHAFGMLNDSKMFVESHRELVPLASLRDWRVSDDSVHRVDGRAPFRVMFADIAIEGREVSRWRQPLFEARGRAWFGLAFCWEGGRPLFLVRVLREAGCFDGAEFGPTLQLEAGFDPAALKGLDAAFARAAQDAHADVVLSEEGGRFFCEENRNTLVEVGGRDALPLEEGCAWLSWGTLAEMAQYPNVLNIQLRNLLSLVDGERFVDYLEKESDEYGR